MPAAGIAEAHPFTQRMLATIPPPLRESRDYRAVFYSLGRELERLEQQIAWVSAQFNPMTAEDPLLQTWEILLRVQPAPPGITIEERRSLVVAMIRKLRGGSAGSAWEQAVTDLVGEGWTYEEHIPGDATSPVAYTVRVTLPFEPTSRSYGLVLQLLRVITPAHIQLSLQSTTGFHLDESQLDVQAFGF